MAKRKQAGPAGGGTPSPESPRAKKLNADRVKPAPAKVTRSGAVKSRPAVPGPKQAARAKATPSRRAGATVVKMSISRRLREIRQDLFGDLGGPELARRLDLPARAWYNYETGVSVPAEVLLAFLAQTGADPWWVLTGEGSKYRRSDPRPKTGP